MRMPARKRKMGMRKAGSPKFRLMKNQDILAPSEPQLLLNSPCWLSSSLARGLSNMLWSAAPVLKYEMKAHTIKTAVRTNTAPM